MEIKKETVVRKQLYLMCMKCGTKIRGTSESQVLHNLRIHILTQHQKANPELTEEQITSDSSGPDFQDAGGKE